MFWPLAYLDYSHIVDFAVLIASSLFALSHFTCFAGLTTNESLCALISRRQWRDFHTHCVAHGEDAEGNRELEARTTVGTGAYVMALRRVRMPCLYARGHRDGIASTAASFLPSPLVAPSYFFLGSLA